VNVIRKKPLAEMLAVGPRTVSDRVKSGALPPPFYIHGIPYWSVDEVENCLRDKMAKRQVSS
jgi:hypothetical protein